MYFWLQLLDPNLSGLNCWFSFPELLEKQCFLLHLFLSSVTKIKMTVMAGSESQTCSNLLFMVRKMGLVPITGAGEWKRPLSFCGERANSTL